MFNFINVLNRIARFLLWIIPISAVIFGVFAYTPEYTGINGVEGLKSTLDKKISISVLMILIGTFTLLFINSLFIKKLFDKTIVSEEKVIQIEPVKNDEQKSKIAEGIKKFCESNTPVVSVQLYKYFKTDLHPNIKYEVKPTDLWYVKKDNSTNLINESYIIKKSYLKKFNKAKSDYFAGDYKALENYIADVSKYFNKFENNLPKLKPKEDDIAKFALLILAIQLNFGGTLIKLESMDDRVFDYFLNIKRTGFLRSVLEDDFYKFNHEGNSAKVDRIYITKCVPIENELFMFVISVNGKIIPKTDWNNSLDKIGKKFYEILNYDLKVVKNDYAS
ncbi:MULTISPECIES: hypothetical protein [Bacillus cereus group]|uniref:hypothetical protein n=1 Tax=Bacillus cereus group TaxID=86661 RepID=UPI000279EEB6|nr:hypothetical protein [Bacillus cereus]EJR29760.1 hypothetical protein IIE_05000 [Bacillus cereus VD045]HDR4347829.1 hypothetical protein [Bacillus cereus]